MYAYCALHTLSEAIRWLGKKPLWLPCLHCVLLSLYWEKLHFPKIKTTCSSGRSFVLNGRTGNLLETCRLLRGKKNILVPGRGS